MIATYNKKIVSYNRTYGGHKKIFYPKNYNEIKKILYLLKKKNKQILIKAGDCGHGDKTNLNTSEYVISLKKINSVKNINTKMLTITVQSGINLYELFKILEKKKLSILNVPGGKNVSLGGAIAGNVHGRPQIKNFATFGDNVISLKVMFGNGKIVNLNKKSKLFYKIIGGLSLFGIILEAKIKVTKIDNKVIVKKRNYIENEAEFKKIEKNNFNFYGYINLFSKKFEGIFFNFKEINQLSKSNLINKIKYSFQDFLYIFKLVHLSSFFINRITLKIFYFILFLFYKNLPNLNNEKKINYEDSIYFIDLNKYLPYYFRGGMIEIQFSVPEKKMFILVKKIKSLFFSEKIFPFFFIIKKLEKSNKKYIFNFPTNKLCISLGFAKKNYLKNKIFFILLYKLLFKNNCNIYVTKDETFLDSTSNKNIKKKVKKNILNSENIISSDFKEKVTN